jgi:hypothetical protein
MATKATYVGVLSVDTSGRYNPRLLLILFETERIGFNIAVDDLKACLVGNPVPIAERARIVIAGHIIENRWGESKRCFGGRVDSGSELRRRRRGAGRWAGGAHGLSLVGNRSVGCIRASDPNRGSLLVPTAPFRQSPFYSAPKSLPYDLGTYGKTTVIDDDIQTIFLMLEAHIQTRWKG